MLRDYQQRIYDDTLNAFKRGAKRPLIVAPCGSGKSYIFAEMVRNAAKRGLVLILVHRIELKNQHEKLFEDLNIPTDNIRINLIISESKHLGEYPVPNLLILDEAHLSKANSWTKVVAYYDTFTVGFTATPCRLDNKPLGDIYDTMIKSPTVKQLTERKCLSPYEYYAPTLIDVSGLKKHCGDYSVNDLEPLVMDKAIYGDILASYRQFADGKKTIAYCVSVAHSKQVSELFRDNGIQSAHIDGNTPKREREGIIEDFRKGKIKVLCNCSVIAEGLSISDCDCCLLLRPTDSLALYIQSSMRCMRYLPEKTATIIDFVGNYTRHGLPDDEREWSLTVAVKRHKQVNEDGSFNIRQCPMCFKTFRAKSRCPYCGFEYTPQGKELKQIKEIELKKIEQEEKKENRKKQGMAHSYGDLVKLGYERGYKNPKAWAYFVMKGR